MSKDYAHKMCAYKCRLEDLIEEYAEMRPSERVAAAMLPLIACWQELDKIGDRMKKESSLSEKQMAEWVSWMQNEDGTTGEHWTMEETSAAAQSVGIRFDDISPACWHTAMNMMYSDYFGAASKFGVAKPTFFAELARDFLFDKDAGGPAAKLAGYFNGVVKPHNG